MADRDCSDCEVYIIQWRARHGRRWHPSWGPGIHRSLASALRAMPGVSTQTEYRVRKYIPTPDAKETEP